MMLEPGRRSWTSRRQAANSGCGRYCSLAYKIYSYNYTGKGRPPNYPLLINMGNYPAKVSKVVKAKNYHQESFYDSSFSIFNIHGASSLGGTLAWW